MSGKGRAGQASLVALAAYWEANWETAFPDLKAKWIGWGEPFCFRCSWLTPVDGEARRPWALAAGWLEKAHLLDHFSGGAGTPDNLVPLCIFCHDEMPDFPDSAESAREWVRMEHGRAQHESWQIFTDRVYVGEAFPGRKSLRIDRLRLDRMVIREFAQGVSGMSK